MRSGFCVFRPELNVFIFLGCECVLLYFEYSLTRIGDFLELDDLQVRPAEGT